MLKEINFPKPEQQKLTGDTCPKCGGGITHGPIPCPDGKPGCCVMHYGFICVSCGKMFQKENV